jgi:hypothetical protein
MPYISPARIRAIQAARSFTGLPVTPRYDKSQETGFVSPPTTAEAAYEQLGMKLVAYAAGQYHAAPSTPSVRYIKRKHVSVH